MKMTTKKNAILSLLLVFPLFACEGILDVTDPDIVTPENLEDDLGLQTLRNGAIGEFQNAYSAPTTSFVSISGLMADEWMHSGTFTDRFRIEIRSIADDNGSVGGPYDDMHQARTSLETTAAKLLEAPNGASDPRVGEMYMYAGFAYLAFGENFCNGVPFSNQTADGIEYGPPETNAQHFDRAIARFQSAIGAGGVAADVANAARVGMGRALINKGDYAGAASAVSGVPDDFVKWVRHSSNTNAQYNGIYDVNVRQGRWSLGDGEGVNGLDFRTSGDPRITSALCEGCAFDKSEQVPGTPNLTDNWHFANYQSWDDDIRLATGIEARLIEAEAQLAGSPGTWLQILNDLRANWANLAPILLGDGAVALPPLTDPGTQAAREDLHFRERAFWNFSTGQRLSDLRRLVRQYGRDSESVFPIGPYWKPGANYSTDVNFLIPLEEENNPAFTGCIDRAA